ncbi:MAG TPA: nuclear transport factor 2 family protein [Solirubrobacterales bacterium]
MTAGENIELVRRAFDRWNSGDREIRPDEVDDEVELHSVLLGGVVRGPEGFRRWFLEIDQQFVEWRSEVAELREVNPDRLLALGRVHLRGRESEVEFDQPMAWLVDFRDGKVIRLEMFPEHSKALKAAGLSE